MLVLSFKAYRTFFCTSHVYPQQCYMFTHCISTQIQICSIQKFSELHAFAGLLKCRQCATKYWKPAECYEELASALCVCCAFLLYILRIRSSKWNMISVSTSSLIFLHLGIISCFHSNLLKCCQQTCPYPADIIWFPLNLTLLSYGEMISFSISISLILPYHMFCGYVCKFLKMFFRGTVLFLHFRGFFWHQTYMSNANQLSQGFACYAHAHKQENFTFYCQI